MNLLKSMTFARRPLSTAEMEHAVTIANDMKVSDIDPEEVLSASVLTDLCAGLVIIDASDKILFVHFTTQDYFLKNSSELFPDAHLALARSCLTYLSMEPFREGPCPINLELQKRAHKYPLMAYCNKNIGWHGRRTESPDLPESIVAFLQVPTLRYSVCQALDHLDGNVSKKQRMSGWQTLHLAAYWGIKDVVLLLKSAN